MSNELEGYLHDSWNHLMIKYLSEKEFEERPTVPSYQSSLTAAKLDLIKDIFKYMEHN